MIFGLFAKIRLLRHRGKEPCLHENNEDLFGVNRKFSRSDSPVMRNYYPRDGIFNPPQTLIKQILKTETMK